ncbi:helix-turn-helix domain-containing protein [Lentzea xinjiangensis]|uniref:helix-turn-helix domain-containing protein n=1 Tax=Lentzea xinjiangensis TaxID=402600 RepID=UPI0015A71B93|nr:helix-turn-helix transcriptional regulator [Lentzea xinjiangensis]
MSRALAAWREESGLSLKEASDAAKWSSAKTSMMQNAAVVISEYDVATLAIIYGVADERRASVFHGAQRARNPQAFDRLPGAPPCVGWDYGQLAAEASTLRIVAIDALPHVVRTPDYASALRGYQADTASMRLHHNYGDESRRHIEHNLHQEASLTLHIIASHALLRRKVGSTPVTTDQLMTIIQLTSLPNVLFQVVPDSAGELATVANSFSIMGFREDRFDDVVYVENHHGATWLEAEDTREPYVQTFTNLSNGALPDTDSTELAAEALQALISDSTDMLHEE